MVVMMNVHVYKRIFAGVIDGLLCKALIGFSKSASARATYILGDRWLIT